MFGALGTKKLIIVGEREILTNVVKSYIILLRLWWVLYSIVAVAASRIERITEFQRNSDPILHKAKYLQLEGEISLSLKLRSFL